LVLLTSRMKGAGKPGANTVVVVVVTVADGVLKVMVVAGKVVVCV